MAGGYWQVLSATDAVEALWLKACVIVPGQCIDVSIVPLFYCRAVGIQAPVQIKRQPIAPVRSIGAATLLQRQT